jgi:hypothetical protein
VGWGRFCFLFTVNVMIPLQKKIDHFGLTARYIRASKSKIVNPAHRVRQAKNLQSSIPIPHLETTTQGWLLR